jgi:hypothetical protein
MADISALGTLAPSAPLDMETYKDLGTAKPFPTKGRYTFRAPEAFPAAAFGKTQAGFLSAQIDPTIAAGDFAGTTVRFTRVSAKPFQRSGATVSQMADYLRATGFRGVVPADPQDLANAIEATANLTYEAYVDWRLYAKGHGDEGGVLEIKGMENFPKNEAGNHVPYALSKTQVGQDGKPMVLRANLEITRFVAPGQ